MMPISNSELTLAQIPADDAPPTEITRFAATFNGYEYEPDANRRAQIAKEPDRDSLDELRCALFLTQRAINHSGYETFDDEPHRSSARGLLASMRRIVSEREETKEERQSKRPT